MNVDSEKKKNVPETIIFPVTPVSLILLIILFYWRGIIKMFQQDDFLF
jgi:hypothetical protein